MKIKSIVSALLALALTAALAMPVFAAEINDDEQRILDAINVTVNGITVVETNKGASYYNQVRNFLLNNDLSKAQADEIIENINAAIGVAAAAGVTTWDELTANTELYNQLTGYANNAARVAGVTLYLDPTTGVVSYKTGSGDGGSSDSAVKATGFDFSASWAVLALVVATTAGCAVFVKKNRVTA